MPGFRTEWDTAPNPTYDVWTVTNGGEVVPGILSPFMASSFNRQDEKSIRSLIAAYPTGRYVKVYKAPIGNFFGVFAGRLALNAGFTAAAMSLLDPGIAEVMLQQFFTGTEGTERFIVRVPDEARAAAVAVAAQQRAEATALLNARRDHLYAERRSAQFSLDRHLGLKSAWKRHEQLTLDNTEALNLHYVVSIAAGEFQVKLMGLLMMGGLDPAAAIGLCSGLGDVESSKPAMGLWDVAQVAKKHPLVEAALRAERADTLLATMAASKERGWAAVAKSFAAFLHDYGYRVQGEADPSNPDWTEQPEFALSQVRAMLDVTIADSPQAQAKRSSANRKVLERTIRKALAAELRVPFDAVLAESQRFTRMREYSKAMWILGTRRQRATYLAICDGLVAMGRAADPDDTRFLLYDEVKTLVAAKPVPGQAAKIRRRRAQYAKAEDYVLPDVWVGDVAAKKRPKVRAGVTAMQGLGVSVGEGPVEGPARIVANVQAAFEREIEDGDILVAPFTDAPWTPLFIPAGAVVVETGGVLSHAATVAREFGIPCVVMVKDATRIIHDGDTVRVDGATGSVTIVARH